MFNENIDGNVELFDAYYGYILIVVVSLPKKKDCRFVRILSSHSGKEYFARLYEQSPLTTAVFNKCRKDVIEFSIGFKSGYLQIITCSLDLSEVISNIGYYCDRGSILSISFMEKDQIAYSVEKHGIMVSKTNVFEDINWANLKDSERCLVTDLQKFTDNILLGIVNNSIYVFEKYENSYALYHDVDKEIIGFTVDLSTNMLVVFCNEDEIIDGKRIRSHFYVLCKIKEVMSRRGKRLTRNKYDTSVIEIIKINNNYLEVFENMEVMFIKGDERFGIYSFLPNIKNNVLEAINIQNGIKCLSVEELENSSKCRGVLCINEPIMLSPTFFKAKIAVIFTDKLVVLDFYCPITDD